MFGGDDDDSRSLSGGGLFGGDSDTEPDTELQRAISDSLADLEPVRMPSALETLPPRPPPPPTLAPPSLLSLSPLARPVVTARARSMSPMAVPRRRASFEAIPNLLSPTIQVPSLVGSSLSQSQSESNSTPGSPSKAKPPAILTRSKTLAELITETTSVDALMAPPPPDAETVDIADYVIPDLPKTAVTGAAALLTDALGVSGHDFSLTATVDELKLDGGVEDGDEKKEDEEDAKTEDGDGAATKNQKKEFSDMEKMEIFCERARQKTLQHLLFDARFSSDLIVRCTIPGTTVVKTWRVNKTFLASCSGLFDEMLFPSVEVTRRLRAKGKQYSCELFLSSEEDATTGGEAEETVAGLDEVEYTPGVAVLDLGTMRPQFVEIIIRHAYFCDPKIPIDWAFEMRVVCADFRLGDLMKMCDDMLSQITAEGVCSLLAQSMRFDIKSLQIKCINEIEARFRKRQMDRMFASKSFREMPVQCMVAILKSDLLRVNEEDLFSHCMVWAQTQEKIMAQRRKKQIRGDRHTAGIAEFGLDENIEIIPKVAPVIKKSSEEDGAAAADSTKKADTATSDETAADATTVAEDEKQEAGADTAPTPTADATPAVSLDDSALIDSLLPTSAASEALKSIMTTAASAPSTTESSLAEASSADKSSAVTDGDELLIRGSEAVDNGQYPVLGTDGTPLVTARDFLEEVKYFVRFPVMEPTFIATIVAKTGVFDAETEYRIVKSILLNDSQMAKPFLRWKRRAAGDFESATHFVRGRGGSSWVYNGSKDCIEVQSNANCFLVGIGLWCGDTGADAHVEIIRGRNEGGDWESRRVLQTPEQEFPLTARNGTPVPFVFPEPFEMVAGQLYTVELHQRNREGNSSMSTESDGWGNSMRNITHGAVTLTFTDAADSPNGSDTGSGGFPVFYVCS